MDEEKEIKVFVEKDVSELRQQLSGFGAVPGKVLVQEDVYYDFPDRRLHDIQHVLRVRVEDGAPKSFSFKAIFHLPKKQDHPWHVVESNFRIPVEDMSSLNETFRRLDLPPLREQSATHESLLGFLKENGLVPLMTIKKFREVFTKDDVEFMVDNVKDLGLFLEVETQTSDPYDVLLRLGMDPSSKFEMGYTGLYAKKFFDEDPEDKLEKFRADPFWNVLSSEREFVESLHKD